jgi:hypothetical protein
MRFRSDEPDPRLLAEEECGGEARPRLVLHDFDRERERAAESIRFLVVVRPGRDDGRREPARPAKLH